MEASRDPQQPGAESTSDHPRRPSESSESAVALISRPARGFVRFLYCSNPFYIVSADLVFVGLRISFGSGGPASRTWALWFGLAGYTLLLATTACFLIRVGKLWDDLRSLLLLIVMMFLAMATVGDDTMVADPARGTLGNLAGLFFALVVTESVLRAIRLRLPGPYRAAYYAILALMFLYPIALAPAAKAPESPGLQWALFAFSPLAGLAFLLLLPAARRGDPIPREKRQPLALAALSLVALFRDRRRHRNPVLFTLCLVSFRQRQPNYLRPLFPRPLRPGP